MNKIILLDVTYEIKNVRDIRDVKLNIIPLTNLILIHFKISKKLFYLMSFPNYRVIVRTIKNIMQNDRMFTLPRHLYQWILIQSRVYWTYLKDFFQMILYWQNNFYILVKFTLYLTKYSWNFPFIWDGSSQNIFSESFPLLYVTSFTTDGSEQEQHLVI